MINAKKYVIKLTLVDKKYKKIKWNIFSLYESVSIYNSSAFDINNTILTCKWV